MKLKHIFVGLTALSLTPLPLWAENAEKAPTEKVSVKNTAKSFGTWGVDLTAMDKSVKPGDNFYEYVNGQWLKTTKIPADKSNYGSFTALADLSEERVRDIIQKAEQQALHQRKEASPASQRLGDLYVSFMDEDTITQKGLAPLQGDLNAIQALKTHKDVAELMMKPDISLRSPVAGWVGIDSKKTDRYIFYLTQSGLGLPSRDYYLQTDERFVEIRKKYIAYITKMLTRAGVENAEEKAKAIMALETDMAKEHWAPQKRRNRDLTYNLMNLKELEAYAPGFPWQAAFMAAGLGDQKEFVVRENTALKALSALFAKTPVQTWKDYLTFHVISRAASYLPKDFADEKFDFYGRTLNGTPEQRVRWKRGVGLVDGALGEDVGQIYVKTYFPSESREKMDDLVKNLRKAFKQRLETLDWMSPATKKEAQTKLKAFVAKIGYPDKWRDYSKLSFDQKDLLGNVKRSDAFEWNHMISKLGKPIDKTEWHMNPQTVNAYYSPNSNEIVFPAAILQPPFFDPKADPAVNYGGIGAVIGHELGHGFDDQGRKSDGTGMLRDWWTKEDAERFKKKTDHLVEQYNAYSPVEGFHVNGKFTLGENIGDLGGLNLAYHAYKLSLGGKEAPVIDGLTGDQRFFLAWAQVWRRLYREEELINRLKTDPHSPSEYRTNGIVRNMDAWYKAFDVKPGDKLYLPPEKRISIW